MEKLLKENKLAALFCTLAEIPSPSLKEERVIEKIIQILNENGVKAGKDEYGNVKAEVPATDASKKPVLFSSHCDVVGDDSPVNIRLNGDFLETDKTRTLGADDKAGVSAIMMLASEIAKDKNLKHGGLEIIFTRDEEQNMTGIRHVKTDEIKSEYVLVCDADKVGQIQIAGAGYTKLTVKVKGLKGGHSGIDIDDKTRLNAVKLVAELVNDIPQGVYKKDETGVITSINAGVIAGGGIGNAIDRIKENNAKSPEYIGYLAENAVTNIINTDAVAVYSLRSSSRDYEKELIGEIGAIIDKFNKKYEGLATAELKTEEHLPPFEKSDDETAVKAAAKACERTGITPEISSFHAGAETHIYANRTNKYGVKMKPVLIGVADVYNMHSAEEKIDWKSHLKGYEFIKEFFKIFNET